MPTIDQFAVILYTVRDHIKTREDALTTFDKIAKIGYKSVQVSGMDPTVIPEEELRDLLLERGLTICATHEPGVKILNETESVIERLQKLGTKYTAYPFPAGIDFANEEVVSNLIKGLDEAGKKMADAGQVLTYHNHAHEFFKKDGKTILSRIYEETNPQYLQGEIDVHWVQRGGENPITWMEKLNGRLPLLHLKDYMVDPSGNPQFAELGNGTLPLKEIVAAAEKSGCQHYIVEQDVCPVDPFESIATSFEYIKKELAN
ncbi:sugar phosphate isomerase/epimerase [Kiritimatiellota bacterium B12222]|nr:sugar phosphate isomerase/epimerase [Kiritimatiellota bacterium B12222]